MRGVGIAVYFSLRRDSRYALTAAAQYIEGKSRGYSARMGRTITSPIPLLYAEIENVRDSKIIKIIMSIDSFTFVRNPQRFLFDVAMCDLLFTIIGM